MPHGVVEKLHTSLSRALSYIRHEEQVNLKRYIISLSHVLSYIRHEDSKYK